MDGDIVHYDDLRGAAGRRAFFRPHRYLASEIFPNPVPRVHVKENVVWSIKNLSLSGLAVSGDNLDATHVDIGDSVPLVISQAGYQLYKGHATLRRIEPDGQGSMLAFQIKDGFIDIESVRKKDAQARMRSRLTTLNPAKDGLVSDAYRVLCSDTLETFRSYKSFLDNRHGMSDHETSDAFDLCVERLLPQWRELWLRGSQLVEPILDDPERLEPLKQMTELVLTPEFCHGPIWHRSYNKPLGYPGDFQVMNYVYDWTNEGETTYDKLIHRIGLETIECVRTRMDVVVNTILRIASEKKPGEKIRALSLGSGPAREVSEIFEATADGDCPVEYTLIDQETHALQYAYEGNYPAIGPQ